MQHNLAHARGQSGGWLRLNLERTGSPQAQGTEAPCPSCAGRTKVHVTGSALPTGPPGRVRLKVVDTVALVAQVSLPTGACAVVATSEKLHVPLRQPQQPGAADTLMLDDCARARAPQRGFKLLSAAALLKSAAVRAAGGPGAAAG